MVYIIRMKGTEFIKIGYSANVEQRIKQLQCGNPIDLEVEHIIPNGSMDLEKALHIKFANFGVSTKNLETCEWFKDGCLKELLSYTPSEFAEIEKEYAGNYVTVPEIKINQGGCTCAELQKIRKLNYRLTSEIRNKRTKIREYEHEIIKLNEKINWWKRQKGLFPEVLELKLVK